MHFVANKDYIVIRSHMIHYLLLTSTALESSLWELSALSHHYYPAVVTLAKSIGTESETTPMHMIDDFLRHTYKSLFEQERKRSKRRKVPLAFVEPKGLFSGEDDVLAGTVRLSPTHAKY